MQISAVLSHKSRTTNMTNDLLKKTNMTNVAKSREDNCKHQKPGGKENEHIG
jgi:hypothetical protein